MKQKIEFTDTILRDAHQSLIATRMGIEDMLPALELLDKAGYWSLEVWGGATFDVCMRFLNEDPWERLRVLRRKLPNTRLQMLLRGQNILGYRHYADDLLEAFIGQAVANGVDVFRVFDALNDIENVKTAMNMAKDAGAIVEGAISYTISPVHSVQGFVDYGAALAAEGADMICIKDMAGILSPGDATVLVGALRERCQLPVHLHCHSASGMAELSYMSGVNAGAAHLDTALSPFASGCSQPSTESMETALASLGFESGLDMDMVFQAAEHFKGVAEKYQEIRNPRADRVDNTALKHQIPGGMLSNMLSMLEMQKASGRMDEVLVEVTQVRKDLGYPPLVTPSSQIVGVQAVTNVLTGKRYGFISKEVREWVKGNYGNPPAPMDPELVKKVLGSEGSIAHGRAADRLEPEMPGALEHVASFGGSREDAISYALFPRVAEDFFSKRGQTK